MNTTKFTMGIVGLVVIILLVTGAVIPAVENAQSEQYETANNVSERFKLLETNETIVLSASADGVYVNDVLTELGLGIYTIAISPTIQISFYKTANDVSFSIQDSILAKAIFVQSANTITLDSGTYTVNTTTPSTGTYSGALYLLDSNGDHGNYEVSSSTPFFINNDGEMMSFIQSNVIVAGNTVNLRGIVKGTVDDIKFVSAFDNTNHVVVNVSDLTVTYGANGVVKIDDLHSKIVSRPLDFTYTVGGVTYTGTAAPINGIVAPIEYKYLSDADSSIINVFSIIPLLLIIVAVLYAVRLMGASRN